MATLNQPASGQHAEVISGIYIARGSETLGPYNSLEAAALVVGGYLRLDDHAACNGDPSWCALANFLPLSSSVSRPAAIAPDQPGKTRPHRWKQLAAAFAVLLATPLLVAGGARWLQRAHPVVAAPAPAPSPVIAGSPVPVAVPAVVQEVPSPSPAPVTVDGPVAGSLSLAGRASAAGVRVSAYPLAALQAALGPVAAEAGSIRARLDPQIEAAARERTARTAGADAALKALRAADPADPLIASLRFASQGATAALRTAENDYRYLSEEREAAAGGEAYFRSLPAPEATADADAQGRFTLPLPPGTEPYAVAASVRWTADDGTAHSRGWLLKLSPAQRAGREPVRMDDGNLSSSSAAESLIHTAAD